MDPKARHDLAQRLLEELFPICRSLSGQGVRQTLERLAREAPWQALEYPCGQQCFDWTIPPEWNVRQAWIADAQGRRLVDFADNNLHLVGYSLPVRATLAWEELAPHLHTLPQMPQAIPYRTSYYRRDWGFCLSHQQYEALDRRGLYQVCIDADLDEQGSLTLAEALLPGVSGREYLFSTYGCHPSLANDNLSGLVLATLLLKELADRPLRHAYRFLMVPETMGAIAYLANNPEQMRALDGGMVITCVGGPGPLAYKETFLGDHHLDRAARQAFRELGIEPREHAFAPDGSDERQYSSPGFRIPVGTICKDKYYCYPQYHTSLDNLELVNAAQIMETLEVYLRLVDILEMDERYLSLNPDCEPQLGRRGLYPQLGGDYLPESHQGQAFIDPSDAALWIMFLADGRHGLLEVARRSGAPLAQLRALAHTLEQGGLLKRLED